MSDAAGFPGSGRRGRAAGRSGAALALVGSFGLLRLRARSTSESIRPQWEPRLV